MEVEKVDDSLWHSHILIYSREDYKWPCILIISIYTHIYFIYPHILLYTIYIYIISVQSYHPLTRMDITLQILYIIFCISSSVYINCYSLRPEYDWAIESVSLSLHFVRTVCQTNMQYETALRRTLNGRNVNILLFLCRAWYTKANKDQLFPSMFE